MPIEAAQLLKNESTWRDLTSRVAKVLPLGVFGADCLEKRDFGGGLWVREGWGVGVEEWEADGK